ncbi:cytochrome c oxidase assembly protein [Arsenicicoccus dermatophilus]|uniref:cytochrome c oxidase assembly protein n=1 Tax=Arsenicicoccus dermatophilus TaxID=1076331 RepID=UPI003916D8FA
MTALAALVTSGTGHEGHAHGAVGVEILAAVGGALLLAAGYLVLAEQQRRSPRGWPLARTLSFLAGAVLLGVSLLPQLSPYPAGSFAGHMHQHLLLGMYAPIGLVLGAPVTLLLRSSSPSGRRVIARVLHSGWVRLVSHPVVALVLNVGVLVALYVTPLYRLTQEHPALHHLVHVHFLAAGCLFSWVIAGPDPAPGRPSVPARLWVLGVAILVHAVLAQVIYAGIGVDIPGPAADRRAGGDLMYYGGDLAELALALAMVSSWRPEPRRARDWSGVVRRRATTP